MVNSIVVGPRTPPFESATASAATPTPRSVRARCTVFIPNRKIHPTKTTLTDATAPLKFLQSLNEVSGLRVKALLTLVGAMASLCVGWTSWLILLIVKPNETVNWVMKTGDFDNGSFWLMVDAPAVMNWLAVSGYSLVWLLYSVVLVRTLRHKNRVRLGPQSRHMSFFESGLSKSRVANAQLENWASHRFVKVAALLKTNRQYLRVWMKFADLTVETLTLCVLLEDGSPVGLVVTLTTIVAMNAFSCAVLMFLPDSYAGLTEVIVDITFDFLFAVAFPMLTVVCCLSSFSLDHAKLTINMEVFPLGAFEREATVIANPAQTDIIYKTLKSLQISSVFVLISRVGVSFVVAYRLYHAVDLIRYLDRRPTRLYPSRHRLSGAFFLVVVVGLVVFVEESIRTSSIACQAHPECAVKAHRWTLVQDGSLTQCPCRALIDVDIAPKSYAEWMVPVDVSTKVVQLASTGDLRTIKLTNRYLPVLPEELRLCREIQYISLMYTYTERIPVWTKEFVNLEYLYIEGASNSALLELPDDMFKDMTSLTFLHLGMHPQLQQLPSFEDLDNLRTLVLAVLVSLTELPSFDSLYNLERMELTMLPTITTLPELKSLQKLKTFIVSGRGTWCCNGFLGECKLSDSFCSDESFSGVSAATCLPSNQPDLVATNATLSVIAKFNATVCQPLETTSDGHSTQAPDTKTSDSGMYTSETTRGGPGSAPAGPAPRGPGAPPPGSGSHSRGGPPPDSEAPSRGDSSRGAETGTPAPDTGSGPGGPGTSENGNGGPGMPTQETIAICEGVLYRNCSISGDEEAMCYNARFAAISCDSSARAIEMRRRQIQERVGDRCNPEYEAWLGCI